MVWLTENFSPASRLNILSVSSPLVLQSGFEPETIAYEAIILLLNYRSTNKPPAIKTDGKHFIITFPTQNQYNYQYLSSYVEACSNRTIF